MIRLTLPPYDAMAPLTIRAQCSTQAYGIELTMSPPLFFRTHPDGFVGDVVIPFNDARLPSSPAQNLQRFQAEVGFYPHLFGMHGGEGWFALEPGLGRVFVHDVQVYFTPPNQQDTGRAGAFFS